MVLKNKKSETTTDELAMMVKRGFDEAGERFSEIEGKIDNLSESNTREHEEMKIRLDNVAHRFELVELQKRVEILERRIG